jgi:ABC-type transporter Mla MlaB component
MLRITRQDHDHGLTLKLEGKLVGPWLQELKSASEDGVCRIETVRLDLGGVSFVDSDGIELLRDLVSRGAQIIASSTFVSELLQRETRS